MNRHGFRVLSIVLRNGTHFTRQVAFVAALLAPPLLAQSPRQANPERPTFATHAYAAAPGYAELEQGLAARGVRSLREQTSWDVNLKLGLSRLEFQVCQSVER